ncbi:hypothetical protein EDC44_1313 [Cricetibacter osteomyelitidis]|uniref:Uncharacterized protein n=1 Tax=Cricetibacter osteomyelitidis TaxID=1521931 RepID=A0A4R2SMN6_9PAST|nr:hypothetical protein [Cricetibacter osteomyelitidis]TCP91297.1 hypothetical protein EDC44_1313 [Cricetibacter osteomyelitidis]
MKRILLILFVLFNVSVSYGNQCILFEEEKLIDDKIRFYNNYYNQVPNMISCKENSALNDLVCSDVKLKKALLLLSVSLVYSYENANRIQIDNYQTYNNEFKDWLNNIMEKEWDKKIALKKLCYIIKQQTTSSLGGDSPYKTINIEPIYIKKNSNGVILEIMDGNIYLGKSCDAESSDKRKGKWYKSGEFFFVELGNDKYKFDRNEEVFSLNCKRIIDD